MHYKNVLKLALVLFASGSCINRATEKDWQPLLNGSDLTGWETFLGPAWDTLQGKWDTIPVGFNADPADVFTLADLEGEKVLRISGEHFGGINTMREFENYHFQMQFKWGQQKWPPRKTGKRDSGLMYHAVGPQGADNGFWMRSQEFQIQEGDCGDYWACAGAVSDITAIMQPDSSYIYSKEGDLVTFSNTSDAGRYCIKSPDGEKPYGEWNTLDLYCFEHTSVHLVNGIVTMILRNSRQLEGNSEIPLTRGKIQIQSEGAEVYFRNIQIRPIDTLPPEILK
jgi:hypothetical protein